MRTGVHYKKGKQLQGAWMPGSPSTERGGGGGGGRLLSSSAMQCLGNPGLLPVPALSSALAPSTAKLPPPEGSGRWLAAQPWSPSAGFWELCLTQPTHSVINLLNGYCPSGTGIHAAKINSPSGPASLIFLFCILPAPFRSSTPVSFLSLFFLPLRPKQIW